MSEVMLFTSLILTNYFSVFLKQNQTYNEKKIL